MQERERKFAVAAEVTTAAVAAALAGEHAPPPAAVPAVLLATYFDTGRLDLAGAGITLRRREGGSDAGWHLKLPASKDERTEYWLPLSAGSGPEVPADLAEMVGGQAGGRRLRPVAQLRTFRTTVQLPGAGAGAATVAELADDRVVAVRRRDGALVAWRELEIEARRGGESGLDDLERRLAELGAVRSPFPSKLARVLAAPAPPEVDADPVVARLAAQVATVIAGEGAVRRGDDEALHDVRVAVRRLRSCLRSFEDAFAEGATSPLVADLREIGQVLGGARDADVLAARLEEALETVPASDVLGPVRAVLRAHAARTSAAAGHALDALIDGAHFADVLEALVAFVAAPPFAAQRRGRRYYAARLAHEHRRVARAVAAAEDLEGSAREGALHEVRKAAKRARYAAETVEPALGAPARRAAERYSELQDALGAHHDAVVARAVLREEGARAGVRPGENGFTFGLLHALEDGRAAAAERRFVTRWRRVRRALS